MLSITKRNTTFVCNANSNHMLEFNTGMRVYDLQTCLGSSTARDVGAGHRGARALCSGGGRPSRGAARRRDNIERLRAPPTPDSAGPTFEVMTWKPALSFINPHMTTTITSHSRNYTACNTETIQNMLYVLSYMVFH